MTTDRTDSAAARILTGAALTIAGLALAVSDLAWSVDVFPDGLLVSFRPPAGSLLGLVPTVACVGLLFRVRELCWTRRLRQAMWTAFAAGLFAAFASWAAAALGRHATSIHLVGPAGLLVPVGLGSAAALALLASSSLYELRCRDPLPPAVVAAAQVRLAAAMHPPGEQHFVYD